MKTVKYEVEFSENASRLELFIRWFWMIPSVIVLWLLAIVGSVAMFLQFFHILALGKRNKTLFDWAKKYITYHVKFMSYFTLTEERSPIGPED